MAGSLEDGQKIYGKTVTDSRPALQSRMLSDHSELTRGQEILNGRDTSDIAAAEGRIGKQTQ
jgi:hypothetical protein